MQSSPTKPSVPGENLLPVENVNVARLPKSGLKLTIGARKGASEAELANLAAFFGVEEVVQIEADLKISRWRKDGVRIAGRIRASLVQQCVVTLEPVESQIDEDFSHLLVPENSPLLRPELDEEGEMVLDPEGDDPPDSFIGENINVWEIVAEHLQLAIDPFVRAEGAELEGTYGVQEGEDAGSDDANEGADEALNNPFKVLASLKEPKKH